MAISEPVWDQTPVKHDHSNFDETADEHWLLHLIDQLSTVVWVGMWLTTILFSAIVYWAASHYLDGHGLVCTMHREMESPVSFPTALYFSCVTTTTLGYGDFAPEGISRVLAILQAFLGMTVVGAVISKVLTHHQGQTIAETNRIAVAERSANVFTALNEQLVEFQKISRPKDDGHDESGHERLVRRWVNAELRFNNLLETIERLLQKQEIPPSTKTKILKALGNTVQEFAAASKACRCSVDSSTSISHLLSICKSTDLHTEPPKNHSVEEILECLNSIDRDV